MFPSRLAVILCFGLFAVGLIAWIWTHSERERRPNLVLITIDTLRADHLDAYGYERPTAPTIARLARGGVRFDYAISQAPWTLPAMASIHTSLYPSEHGAFQLKSKIGPKVVTLAEVLREVGYHTIGVVSHVFVSHGYGMAQGFVEFDTSQIKGHGAVTAGALSELAGERIAVAPRPFFLWVHYLDPHFTYIRHPKFPFAVDYEGPLPAAITEAALKEFTKTHEMDAADTEYVEAVYDEEIAHTDMGIGRLIDRITSLGLSEEVVYVLTADHGEYFMERGRYFHGKDVYDELIRVPLVIGGAIDPELVGQVVAPPVETRSIAATLMALARVDEHPFGGQDLLEVARTGKAVPYVYSEGSHAKGIGDGVRAVVGSGWKLIHTTADDLYELYDLAADPAEQDNRYGDRDPKTTVVRDELKRALDRLPRELRHRAPEVKLSEERKEHLRALGYGE